MVSCDLVCAAMSSTKTDAETPADLAIAAMSSRAARSILQPGSTRSWKDPRGRRASLMHHRLDICPCLRGQRMPPCRDASQLVAISFKDSL